MLTAETETIFVRTTTDYRNVSLASLRMVKVGHSQNKTTDMISKPIIIMTFRPANLIGIR